MAYLTLFCRKFPKNSRKKSQRSGRGSSRLGQNPNFYRKFVLHASLRAECQSAFSTRRSKRVKEISFMTVSSTILRILRTKISRCAPSMFTMFIKCQYIQQGKASRSKHIVSSKKYYKSRSLNVKCKSIDEIRNKPNKCNWEY